MITEEIEVLKDHASALNRHAAALEEQNKIRAIELKSSAEDKRRERARYKKWLYANEVVTKLKPYVNQVQLLKNMREVSGRFGMPGEGHILIGRTYFYNPTLVDQLLKKFQSGTLETIRRNKSKKPRIK